MRHKQHNMYHHIYYLPPQHILPTHVHNQADSRQTDKVPYSIKRTNQPDPVHLLLSWVIPASKSTEGLCAPPASPDQQPCVRPSITHPPTIHPPTAYRPVDSPLVRHPSQKVPSATGDRIDQPVRIQLARYGNGGRYGERKRGVTGAGYQGYLRVLFVEPWYWIVGRVVCINWSLYRRRAVCLLVMCIRVPEFVVGICVDR